MSSWPPLSVLALLFIRAIGAAAPLPLGSGPGTLLPKFAVALSLTLLAGPSCQPAEAVITADVLLGEIWMGFLLSLVSALMVETAGVLGELLDGGRGQNFAAFYDPLSETCTPALAQFLRWYCLTLLVSAGGAEALAAAFFGSLSLFPPGSSGFVEMVSGAPSLRLFQLLSEFWQGLSLAFLPFACGFLVIEACLGAAARLVPGICSGQEGFLLKSGFSFVILMLAAGSGAAAGVLHAAQPLLHLLGG